MRPVLTLTMACASLALVAACDTPADPPLDTQPAMATAAFGLPMFNANCPTDISVHADENGPVYIMGTEATLSKVNDSYYEASLGETTISISVNADRTVSVGYTGSGGANGVCSVTG
jgi:hypothetical protein